MNGAEGASPGAQLRMVDPSPPPECQERSSVGGTDALLIIAFILSWVVMAWIKAHYGR